MANPYHDETGKFCKKEEMLGAIARLHQEGRTAEAVKLFFEYKEVEEAASAPKARRKTPTTPAPTGNTDTPAIIDEGSPEQVARTERELAHLITHLGLSEGSTEHRELTKAEAAFQRRWEREDLPTHLTEQEVEVALEEGQDVIPFYQFEDQHRKENILFIYNRRLYTTRRPLEDEWGSSTKFSDVEVASTSPYIVAPYVEKFYQRDDKSDPQGKKATAWGKKHSRAPFSRNPRQVSMTDSLAIQGMEKVSTHEEETAFGYYTTTTVWRDPADQRLYEHTESWDSWDNGNYDVKNQFRMVTEAQRRVYLDPQF